MDNIKQKKKTYWGVEVNRDKYREARHIANDYLGAKLRVIKCRNRRPTLLKQLKVSTDEYEQTGFITYDAYAVHCLDTDDYAFFKSYEEDMHNIWLVEHVVDALPGEMTKKVAEETILKGKSCSDIVSKLDIELNSIQKHRRKAIKYIACVLP